jgi:hypothetical protein
MDPERFKTRYAFGLSARGSSRRAIKLSIGAGE